MGNSWVNLVVVLALFEYFALIALVGRARGTYGVKAPATTGNEMFERYFRVHYNTLELLIAFIPALWIASAYWNPVWMAAIGAVYLLGRILYLQGYTTEPKQRALGYLLSAAPIVVLAFVALCGVVRALLA